MGMFFSNLHIRKNEKYNLEELKQTLIEEMKKKGYTLPENEKEAEVSAVIYTPKESEWVTVASDCFSFSTAEETKAAAFPLSEKFGTDVLAAACFDSDYLMMNLINAADGTDGWVNVGSPYDMKVPRRTGFAPWRGKVTDIEKFKAAIREKNVFAEEAFYGCAELLGMTAEQCVLDADTGDEFVDGDLTKLYFSLPEGTKKEPPRFVCKLFSLMPCTFGENTNVFFVNNKGGRSKGVGVMFVGDYIKNDEITFENVTFESDPAGDNRKIIPIKLEKTETVDGQIVLYWEDENYPIPPAVDPGLPPMRRDELEHKREFGVRFTPVGNPRKKLDVTVWLIPLENREGSDCWFCYRHDGTKERYIERYNKDCQKFFSLEPLDPKDFDL